MNLIRTAALAAVCFAATVYADVGHAAGTESMPVQNRENADFAAGKRAVEQKNWSAAAAAFERVVAREPNNADAFTQLGYANRWLGKMDESFAAYAKALKLDPDHRGAHQYLGVAYLKVGDLANAEAQLAEVQRVSGTRSDEYRSLADAIASYKNQPR